MSKFRKDDRLHPIITIVVSYSEKPWDGPLTLRDMMEGITPDMDKFFSDYRMNLIEVRDSAHLIFHNEDVKDVFDICREIFHDNLDTVRKNYKDKEISIDAATAIQSITKISSLFEISTKGVTTMNMCTALEKLKNEGIELGRNEGIELGRNEGKTEILIQLVKEGLISFSDAAERLNISEDKFKALM